MSSTRFIAVATVPGSAPRFCGHIHRSQSMAERCRVRIERRFAAELGARVEVARAWDAETDPCVLRDYHQAGRRCPACGLEG